MKIKLNEKNLKFIALCLAPFFVFIAIDGTFSIQSILPIVLFVFCIDITYKNKNANKIVLIATFLFMFSTLVSLLINTFKGTDLTTNQTYFRILYYLIIIYFYFSLTRVVYNKRQIEIVFMANIICGVGVALYLIFVNHIWAINLLGTKFDKNFIGAILTVQGEIAFIKAVNEKKIFNKLINMLCYLIIFVGIFYSASRASMMIIILGTIIIIFFRLKQNMKTKNEVIKLIICIFVLMIIGYLSYVFMTNKIYGDNMSVQWYWERYFVNGFSDESVTGRWDWWEKAISLWQERPFCGYGIGNINVSGNSSAVTHNTYIDLLIDQGIIGFLGFCFIWYRSTINIIKNKYSIYYSVLLTVSLLAFILSAGKSTFLWYNLILLYCIGNSKYHYENKSDLK